MPLLQPLPVALIHLSPSTSQGHDGCSPNFVFWSFTFSDPEIDLQLNVTEIVAEIMKQLDLAELSQDLYSSLQSFNESLMELNKQVSDFF